MYSTSGSSSAGNALQSRLLNAANSLLTRSMISTLSCDIARALSRDPGTHHIGLARCSCVRQHGEANLDCRSPRFRSGGRAEAPLERGDFVVQALDLPPDFAVQTPSG